MKFTLMFLCSISIAEASLHQKQTTVSTWHSNTHYLLHSSVWKHFLFSCSCVGHTLSTLISSRHSLKCTGSNECSLHHRAGASDDLMNIDVNLMCYELFSQQISTKLNTRERSFADVHFNRFQFHFLSYTRVNSIVEVSLI